MAIFAFNPDSNQHCETLHIIIPIFHLRRLSHNKIWHVSMVTRMWWHQALGLGSVAPQWSALKNASSGSHFGKLGTGQTVKNFEKALVFKEKFYFYLCHWSKWSRKNIGFDIMPFPNYASDDGRAENIGWFSRWLVILG